MTSKLTRERIELIANFHRAMTLPPSHDEIEELARMALAAMDSSESVELPLDYLQGHKDGLEWAAQLAEANHPETGDWLYDDPIELAKAIRKGPDMPPAQSVDSEPVAWTWQHREQWHITNDEERVRDLVWDGVKVEPLYRHAQPAPVVVPDGLNPETTDLVLRFASALADKLYKAEQKYGRSTDWMKDDWYDDCLQSLWEHIGKGDPRDVAAYCAFMWYHGWVTTDYDRNVQNACRAAMLQDGTLTNEGTSFQDNHSVDDTEKVNSPLIPDGYVMVPKEPTAEMVKKMRYHVGGYDRNIKEGYKAMLAVAPQLPGSESATVPGKWIPVSERMPEDDDFVYIWPRPDFGVELHVGQYCECSPKGDGWYAQVYEQNYGIEWHPITVTHWMPLPAGPKEDINALIPLVSRNEQEGK